MSTASSNSLRAGAAQVDISPVTSQFLYGYPHVERMSTGVHDPLFASALYLDDGRTPVLLIANDIIFVSKPMTRRVRQRLAETTGVPAERIMITATHTHSAPMIDRNLVAEADPAVPAEPDAMYLALLERGMIQAGEQAARSARPAQAGLVVADATGIGTNRHDPKGASDLRTPVLMVREAGGGTGEGAAIAAMLVVNMHPTVLHEDSTLVSGDIPGMARQYLQRHVVGENCPVLYHNGASGNQSPRHVTQANTFAEARRLGDLLGKTVEQAAAGIEYRADHALRFVRDEVTLPLRSFPPVAQAEAQLKATAARLDQLRRDGAPRTEVRTAECDWFGAEETVTLARAAESGRLRQFADEVSMPAEIQAIGIGPWTFVGWPGEVFVEFGLQLKQQCPDTFLITLANATLQGYLVTQQAIDQGKYEALNAAFQSPDSGEQLVQATVRLLGFGV